jgi:hypothetical protein
MSTTNPQEQEEILKRKMLCSSSIPKSPNPLALGIACMAISLGGVKAFSGRWQASLGLRDSLLILAELMAASKLEKCAVISSFQTFRRGRHFLMDSRGN